MLEQAVTVTNPFPGLRPFAEEESELFFGRDGQSDEVLTKLRRARFVAVVGTSGSGKSSLVRAGVLPALRSGHLTSAGSRWRVALFRPGNDPIGNLAEALSQSHVLGDGYGSDADARREIEATLRSSSLGLVKAVTQAQLAAHENLLLVADQFEELFRFRKNIKAERPEDEAAAFVKLLLEARLAARESGLPVYLILTMRSDYLGEAAQFRGLPEAINEGQYLIPRMNDDEWREAITGPIWMSGAAITPQLVNRLLNDTGDRTLLKTAGESADRLPILQHALMRTWKYWRDHHEGDEPIGIPHYLRIGGLERALSLHADEAFFELSARQQAVAEKLFKRLTEKSADGREGRRPATLKEIGEAAAADEAEVKSVIESFRREGRSFLMPPSPTPLAPDTLIDISHESLIWGWERLRDWVDEEAQSARIYQRLAGTFALYTAGQEGYLRNPALQVALDWRDRHHPNATWARRYQGDFDKVIAFLDASRANFEREEAEREQQRQRELAQAQEIADERQRRVKLQRIGLIVLSALLLGLMGLTGYAFQLQAEAQKQKSEAEKQNAEAQKQKGIAEQQSRVAVGERDRAEAEKAKAVKALADAESARHEAEQERNNAQRAQAEAERQRNEAERAKASAQTALQVAEEQRQTAEEQKKLAVEERKKAEDALRLVTEIDRSAPFFKATWRDYENPILATAFTPDGKKVIAADGHGIVKMLEVKDAPEPTGFAITPFPQTALAFNRDGTRYLISQNTGRYFAGLQMRNVTGSPSEEVFSGGLGYTPRINHLGFSPDNSLVAVTVHNSVWVWDASTKERLFEIPHKGGVNHATFSPDSKLIVTASDDGTAEVWNTRTKQRVRSLTVGYGVTVSRAAFSHDGKFIVTASADGQARVWDVESGVNLLDLNGHKAEITSVAFSPDDRLIVTTSKDRTARIWQFDAARQQTGASNNIVVLGVAAQPEVKSLVLAGHEAEVNNAIFSPDGRWVITASQDRTARIWQAVKEGRREAGEQLAVLRGHIGPITSLDFNGEKKYVVTGSADRTVRVWDVSQLGGLRVSAELKADTPSFSGDCPVTVKLTGTVTIEGGGGTVKYQFITSDGELTKPQELVFDAPGKKEISETWTLNRSVKAGWAALRIIEPQSLESARANISVSCANYEKQTTVAAKPLTEDTLRQIMPRVPQDKLKLYLPHLQRAMDEFQINTPARQAAFLAQVAHESRELQSGLEESVGLFNTTLPGPPFFDKYDRRADLGNQGPPDGERFKGRGVFQITGRAHYQRYGQLLGENLLDNPARAAEPEVTFRIAAVYWRQNGLNELADVQDFQSITRKINGGLNGLDNRLRYYAIAKQVLGVGDIEGRQFNVKP